MPGLLELLILAVFAAPVVAVVLVVRWVQRKSRPTSGDVRPAPSGDHWRR